MEELVVRLSAEIRGLTADGDTRRAAMSCVELGDALANGLGNLTAARAWFTRAARLLADEPPCVEQGWVAVAAMGCDVDDPAELLAAAELALDRARRFGDVDLETKALADAGLAHVQSGRVDQGMALLDEAMALACGPAAAGGAAPKSVCSFFTACYHAADFSRAGSWAELLRRAGLIGASGPAGAFLSSHCDSVQATLLMELGQWREAEAVLTRAKAEFEAVMPIPAWHADIALADLRVRQGRLVDAEALLLGKDQHMQALLPAARLHLARGDVALALACARRGLRGLGFDRLRAAELLTVLVDASLAAGDIDGAAAAAGDLATRTDGPAIPAALWGRATAARARVAAARGDRAGAVELLEGAVDRLDVGEAPWLRAMLLLDLARLRDDPAAATIDATAAASILQGLDVVLAEADQALLASLGLRPAGRTVTLARDGKWWTVSCDGQSVRLKDTKGLRYLALLVASPGQERHALDLVDQVEGVGDVDRRALGDAGAVLDARARADYRRRIEELRTEAADALEAGQLETAEALQEELDQLVRQLAAAFGLGGRDRRAASAAERARLNVTRALRAATARLAEALPGLTCRIRTGLFCAYEDDEVRWIVLRHR